MKYRLFFVIFLSSVLDILLGTFLQISIVSIGWLVLYSGLFEAGVFLLANKGVAVKIKEVDIRNRFKVVRLALKKTNCLLNLTAVEPDKVRS